MTEQKSRLVIEIDSRNAERNARVISNELQSIERNGNYATRSMDSMSVATRNLAGYMMGLVTVGTAISKMDTYTGLNNKLKLVTNSQTELNKALSDTFRIAQNTAQAWDSISQIYQRFSDNAKRLNITQEQTATLTDTVAKAISISGGSAASAEAALIQFSQALASNVLRGEELNSVMEQAPGLAKAIAQGMGITVGQLRSVAAEGKITGDVLVAALTKAKGSVDDLFSKTDFTISQSFTQLSNEVTKFVGEAGKGSGVASTLSSSIKTLADNLEPIAHVGAAVAIGVLAKAMMGGAVATTNATYSLIAKVDANIAERQANIAATQAESISAATEARSTQITLTNTKATHAQIMAEIELEKVRLKSQFTDQGRMATTTRMAQLGRLQAQVALEIAAAETAQASASARLITAQTALTAATSRLALAKVALMSIFSPIGIAIAATAATFYLLSRSSDEVKESLATQSDSVETLTKKYLELNSVQALVEGVRLRKEIEQQNNAIDDASSATKRFAYFQKEMFKLSGSNYEEYQKAIISIKNGANDAGIVLQKMIQSGRFTQPQIDKLIEYSNSVAESKNKVEQNNSALKLLGATSSAHTKITAESVKQIGIQANVVQVATQNFNGMKKQMLDSLKAQVEFSKLNGASEEKVKSLNNVIKEYSANHLTALDSVTKFNGLAVIPENVGKSLKDYALKTDKAKTELTLVNVQLKDIQANSPKTKQAFIDLSDGVVTADAKVAALNEKLKDFNKTVAEKKYAAEFKFKLVSDFNYSDAQAEALLQAKLAANKAEVQLTSEMAKSALSAVNAEEKYKDTVDAKTKAQKDHTKELEKQQKILSVNAQVQANASKYGFSGLESKYGLPSGLLSGIHMQESHGNGSAIGPKTKYGTAKGGFQMLDGTASRFGLKGDDVFNIGKSADAAGKYLQFLYKKFGNWEKAISAYHAGEGNVEKNTGIGPINRQYVKNVKGYVAGATGYSGDTKDFNSWLSDQTKDQIKSLEEYDDLKAQYASEDIRRFTEHNKRIEDLQKHGLDSLVQQENINYVNSTRLSQLQFEQQVDGWKWVGEEKIRKDAEIQKTNISLQINLSDIQKQLAKETVDEQVKYEIDQFKKTQQIKQLEYQSTYNSRMKYAQGGIAQYTLSPFQFQRQNLVEQQTGAYSNNDQSLIDDLAKAEQAFQQKEINTQEHFRRMEDAQRLHKENEYAISLDYKQRADDLNKDQQVSQLNLYSSMLSQGATVWGSMTQMVKDAKSENSKTYKAMFLGQQAIAMGQQVINTELAAMQPIAQMGIYGLPASFLIRGMGYASLGIIAAQTVAGFSSGGYTGDGGKYAAAGIVHKGEVVFSQEDIARWGGVANVEKMRTGGVGSYSDGGVVGASANLIEGFSTNLKPAKDFNPSKQESGVTVNINVPAGYTAKESRDSNGNVTVDVVRQEIANSWNNLSRANSSESRQIQSNFGLAPAR